MRDPEAIKAEMASIANQASATIDALQKELKAAQKDRKKDAIAQVKRLITDNELTAEDLGFIDKSSKAKIKQGLKGKVLPPAYRLGKVTWTGRGSLKKEMLPYKERDELHLLKISKDGLTQLERDKKGNDQKSLIDGQ